ncbi:MAG: hypothetical protein GX577_10535 [Leptolinea sp.]|nr:hypothetical protein [Leptolinea sp.]
MNNSQMYLFELFLIEFNNDKTQYVDVLYGWCLPTNEQDSNLMDSGGRWNPLKSGEKYRFRVAKNYLNSAQVESFFSAQSTQKKLIDLLVPLFPELQFNEIDNSIFRFRNSVWIPPKNQGMMTPPYGEHGLYCTSLYRVNKTVFLTNEVTPIVIEHLRQTTGFKFSGINACRLGNLELLHLVEKRSVHVFSSNKTSEKKCHQLCVQLGENAFPECHGFVLRVKLENGGAVILDQCRTLSRHPFEQGIIFDAAEQISTFEVQLYGAGDVRNELSLIFEEKCGFLHSINVTMHSVDMCGTIQGDRKLKKAAEANKKLVPQVKPLQLLSRRQPAVQMITNPNGPNFWSEIVQASAKNVSYLLPPEKSEGRFFSRGWGSVEDAEDQYLGFRKWLRETIQDGLPNGGDIFIVDPYFDEVGLGILLHMDEAQYRYVVLLNSDKNKDTAKLLAYAEKIRELLKYRNIEIYDYPKKDGKPDSLHDRYLILRNASEHFHKGFHLSNSLQKACENHPLLITPIPSDVLVRIQEYLSGLLEKLKPNPLWPIPKEKPQIADESISLSEEIEFSGFKNVFDRLDASNIAVNWSFIADAISNNNEALAYFEEQISVLFDCCDELVLFLKNVMEQEVNDCTPDPMDMGYFELFKKCDFRQLINDLNPNYMRRSLNQNYAIYYGLIALLANDIKKIDQLLFEINNSKYAKFHRMLLCLIANEYCSKTILTSVIRSTIPALRAIGVRTLFSCVENDILKEFMPSDLNTHLLMLSNDEQLLMSAYFLGSVWKSGDKTPVELARIRAELKESLLQRVIDLWPIDIENQALSEIMDLCDRPVGGYDTVLIANELLIPLVEQGKLSYKAVGQFWFDRWLNIIQGKGNSLQFEQLNHCLVWLFSNQPEITKNLIEVLENEINVCFRVLAHPLAYFVDHRKAYAKNQSLIRLASFVMHTRIEEVSILSETLNDKVVKYVDSTVSRDSAPIDPDVKYYLDVCRYWFNKVSLNEPV